MFTDMSHWGQAARVACSGIPIIENDGERSKRSSIELDRIGYQTGDSDRYVKEAGIKRAQDNTDCVVVCTYVCKQYCNRGNYEACPPAMTV